MKDPGSPLRKAYYQALHGNLTHNAVNVPVFSSKVEGDPFPQLYVLINITTMEDKSNNTRFVHLVTVSIDVVNIRNSTAQGGVMDDVTDQILTIIKPTPQTDGFVLEDPFTLTFCRFGQSNIDPVRQIDANKFLHVKTIILINRITQ